MKVLLPASRILVFVDEDAGVGALDGTKEKLEVPPP